MIYVLVFVGGIVGALARYHMDRFVKAELGTSLPWGTLAVNLTGSIILGLLMGAFVKGGLSKDVLAFVGTGICGALTTFSTFSNETFHLSATGSSGRAWANIIVSIILGVLSLFGAYSFMVAML